MSGGLNQDRTSLFSILFFSFTSRSQGSRDALLGTQNGLRPQRVVASPWTYEDLANVPFEICRELKKNPTSKEKSRRVLKKKT